MGLAGVGIVLIGAGVVLSIVAARTTAGVGSRALRVRGNIRILSHHRHKSMAGPGKASGAAWAAYLRCVGAVLIFADAMIFWTLLVQHFFE